MGRGKRRSSIRGVEGGEMRGEVWGKVMRDVGIAVEEVWGSVLGCGGGEERCRGMEKCRGGGGRGVGKCVGVWGEVRRDVGKGVGICGGGVKKCVGVWGEVKGDVGRDVGEV